MIEISSLYYLLTLTITFIKFSDVFEYPYYLKSVEQILEENNHGYSIRQIYDYIGDIPELVGVGIDPDISIDHWLCFSDCMNNGGTSSLYIDFNPLPEGTPGQVIRYLHDPDSYKVIAHSFDEYLQMLIKSDYSFILPEDFVHNHWLCVQYYMI